MKISILLPYKENFSPIYAGAVSLFVKDTVKISKYKNNITIYGNTNLKKIYNLKYSNLDLKKDLLASQSKTYVDRFIDEETKNKSDIVEVHNRPIYIKYLINEKVDSNFVLYFHNDPLSMTGSKTINDRKLLLSKCEKIIFNSQWSKKRFLQGIKSSFINSDKLLVIYQSAKKSKTNKVKKLKWITFVGKLNKSKGYDIYGNAVCKILDKYKDWRGIVIGDEQRDKIIFQHKNLKILGFLKHEKVLDILSKTSIAVACSRWDEPLGRTSLEASSKGCAVIISNKGGLPETVTNAIILKQLSQKNLYDKLRLLIKNSKLRKRYQDLSRKNFFLTHEKSAREIDNYRNELTAKVPRSTFNSNNYDCLKILHVTNFNERHDGRLFFNSGRRINNGLIRMGHSVLEFSDRDIQKHYKSLHDFDGSKKLNEKLIVTCYNFKPDLIILGHADSIYPETLQHIKKNYPNLKVAQWFLDPLNKNGPDYLKNKKRVLDKKEFIDSNFLTTSPDVLKFLSGQENYHYIPNPSDPSFETLNNYNKQCPMDVFYALSHGVHRGVLKRGKYDERELFINKLMEITPNVKFDIYGLDKVQPIWADNYLKSISNSKMGLNLSRGEPIKYYSSDRITQIIGNGLLTFVDEGTQYRDFFNDDEIIFYKNINDLSEKIQKYCFDDKLRKKIARNGKLKYMKYFNSELVSQFILQKTFNYNTKKKFLWSK